MATASQSSGTIAQTITGARAKLSINGKTIGLATDCNWNYRIGEEPVFILGRYEAAEIVPTSQEPVDITVNGLRIFQNGPHFGYNGTANSEVMVPVLSTLLSYKDILIEVYDRQNPNSKPLISVKQCRSTGYSSSINAKGLMTMSMSFTGIRQVDELTEDSQIIDATASTYGISG